MWKETISLGAGTILGAIPTLLLGEIAIFSISATIGLIIIGVGVGLYIKRRNMLMKRLNKGKALLEDEKFKEAYKVFHELENDCMDFTLFYHECKMNEGIALCKYAITTGIDEEANLIQSISILKEEQSYYSEDTPEYFSIMKNIGTAYLVLSEIRNKKEYLNKAEGILESLLSFVDKSDKIQYSSLMINLGNVYKSQAGINSDECKKDYLTKCFNHYMSAKEAIEPFELNAENDDIRKNYAKLLVNIGYLCLLSKEESMLSDAKKCFTTAIKILKPDVDKYEYSLTKLGFGVTLAQMEWKPEEQAKISQNTIDEFELSKIKIDEKEDPKQYARSMEMLGIAYTLITKSTKNRKMAMKSKGYFEKALEFFTCGNYPYRWATIQKNIAVLYLIQGYDLMEDTDEDIESCLLSIHHGKEMFNEREYPIQHKDFDEQYKKVKNLYEKIKEKREDLEEPIY